jgi:hypothetical protein
LVAAQVDRIFIWKCFGDALAHIYIDQFSIKHAFFEIDEFAIKRDAGMLTGKTGLRMELACLDEMLEAGSPAVLCDITNVLRYGDVCLLGESDPLLLEVKSGSRLNRRGQRQLEKIERLHTFLMSDQAEQFRGTGGTVRRVAFSIPLRTNIDALNACIRSAKQEGQAIAHPESGLTFVAVYGRPDLEPVLTSIPKQPSLVFSLNGDKNDHAWSPYIPFILSIRDGEHLLDFIEGRLFLLVFLNPQSLCEAMATEGWKVRFNPAGDYMIQCFHPETRAYMGVSSQFLARAAYDFVALSWIAEVQAPSLANMGKLAGLVEGDVEMTSAEARSIEHEELLREFLADDDPWLEQRGAT